MEAQPHNAVRMLHPTATLLQDHPGEVGFSVYHVRKKLEVKGQGTVGFSYHARKRFRIMFRSGCSSLMVDIGESRTSFRFVTKGQIDRVLCEVEKCHVDTDPFFEYRARADLLVEYR